MLVLVVVDGMVSSSTTRDFYQNSFWQHHCDGTRMLYRVNGPIRNCEFLIWAKGEGGVSPARPEPLFLRNDREMKGDLRLGPSIRQVEFVCRLW